MRTQRLFEARPVEGNSDLGGINNHRFTSKKASRLLQVQFELLKYVRHGRVLQYQADRVQRGAFEVHSFFRGRLIVCHSPPLKSYTQVSRSVAVRFKIGFSTLDSTRSATK